MQVGVVQSLLADTANGVESDTANGVRNGAVVSLPAGDRSQDRRGTEDEIRHFLADIFFLGEDPASLSGSESLITAGVIDSTGVLELVGFLEEQYAIRIEDDELLPENLDSIENIVRFVERKQAAA